MLPHIIDMLTDHHDAGNVIRVWLAGNNSNPFRAPNGGGGSTDSFVIPDAPAEQWRYVELCPVRISRQSGSDITLPDTYGQDVILDVDQIIAIQINERLTIERLDLKEIP